MLYLVTLVTTFWFWFSLNRNPKLFSPQRVIFYKVKHLAGPVFIQARYCIYLLKYTVGNPVSSLIKDLNVTVVIALKFLPRLLCMFVFDLFYLPAPTAGVPTFQRVSLFLHHNQTPTDSRHILIHPLWKCPELGQWVRNMTSIVKLLCYSVVWFQISLIVTQMSLKLEGYQAENGYKWTLIGKSWEVEREKEREREDYKPGTSDLYFMFVSAGWFVFASWLVIFISSFPSFQQRVIKLDIKNSSGQQQECLLWHRASHSCHIHTFSNTVKWVWGW